MNVYIGGTKDYSAMRGPCAEGFHVPLKSEWEAVNNAGIALGAWSSSNGSGLKTYLKIPCNGSRGRGNTLDNQGTEGCYSTSSANTNNSNQAYSFGFNNSATYMGSLYRSLARGIRPFKDTPVFPDNSWTVLKQGTGTAGIYRNSSLGLISISSDGTTWYTLEDKNLGATTVYNDGDTLSEANCGKYYQWGNNYGFPRTGSVTTSTSQVNASSYGPGNYYSSSTFIVRTGTPAGWDSSGNDNLRGGVTGIVSPAELKNAYIGEYIPPLVLQQVFDFTTSDLHGYTRTKDPNNSYGLTINTSGGYCTGGGTGGAGQIWKQINAKRYWGRIKFMVVNQIYGGVIVGGWGYTGTPTQQNCGADLYTPSIYIASNNVGLATMSASYSLNTYYYLDGKFDNGNYTCTLYDVNMNKLKEITATNSDTVWGAAGFGGWGGRNSQSCFRIYEYREAYDNN